MPLNTTFDDLVNPVNQANMTEEIIQKAAERVDEPAGAVLAQIAHAQSNLAVAAALTQINSTLKQAHDVWD